MLALFTKFWFAFLPLVFYVIWAMIMRRRVGVDGRVVADHIRKTLLFWAMAATALLLIGAFLILGFNYQDNQTGRYVPPKSVDGVIVPGHVIPQQPAP